MIDKELAEKLEKGIAKIKKASFTYQPLMKDPDYYKIIKREPTDPNA